MGEIGDFQQNRVACSSTTNAIRILSCIFVMAAGLTLHGAPAAASPVVVPCGTAINGYLSAGMTWLDVEGTRITARGTFGFHMFTMDDSYNLSTTPLNTPAAGGQARFTADRGPGYYTGQFREVFPERGNSDTDLSTFWTSQAGLFWVKSITWNGTWRQLQGTICYRGPGNQTVVTGYIDDATWGPDFWTFLIQGDTLI